MRARRKGAHPPKGEGATLFESPAKDTGLCSEAVETQEPAAPAGPAPSTHTRLYEQSTTTFTPSRKLENLVKTIIL